MILFRPTVPEDLLTIERWIEADPAHKGMDGNFWIATSRGISCYAIGDEAGPLMFVRQEAMATTCILHVQFANCGRKKIFNALRESYPLVREDAKQRGFTSIRFESSSPALIRTMLDMGFRAELVADL